MMWLLWAVGIFLALLALAFAGLGIYVTIALVSEASGWEPHTHEKGPNA